MQKLTNIFGALSVGVLIAGGLSLSFYMTSKTRGKEYLEERGYTNIQGGRYGFINSCGKNETARYYNVEKDGKKQDRTVCLGLLRYIPIIE